MSALERITIDPSVRFGKPCVRGTRITVGDVLGYLAAGMAEDQPTQREATLHSRGKPACPVVGDM